MSQSTPRNFEPYSEKSLKAVEDIEFLPDSIAFEHMLYNNRLERTATYEYSHTKSDNKDNDPLVIDPSLMVSQFPEALRGLFPEVSYTIEQLVVSQTEGVNNAVINLSFLANGTAHSVVVTEGLARYETVNDFLDTVVYTFSPEAITGLIASFVYAKQYDPTQTPHAPIELIESVIDTERDQQLDLIERMIMTLGDHSGQAKTETRALFDNPSGAPIIATLTNKEFPDKSAKGNTLVLSELGDINDLPTSVETTLYQNIVDLEEESSILGAGRLTNRYAEQRSMVLSALPFPTSELIDPDTHYARWAKTCSTFLKIIKKPMRPYAHLDEQV